MDDYITDDEIAERNAELARILSHVKPESIRAGEEAYKHELLQLLAEDREGHSVAYRNGTRIAIAPTRDELREILACRKPSSSGDLFITRVTSTDVEDYSIKR
jgi:hypothetical protein